MSTLRALIWDVDGTLAETERDGHRVAFNRAFAANIAEIEAIAGNRAKPTFENTIEALKRSGRALERVADVFYNLAGADTHPDIRSHLYRLRSHLHDITERLLQASAPGPVQPGTLRACATAWVSAMFSAASTDRWLDLDGLPRNREDLRTVARVIAAGMTGMGKLSFG